ncbi:phosphotransferase family protein [Embleya sp. NPDC050154]|uniref:phosphotransferase family protein n=1 Tax=Embleya sp. NPDC050154 TaxID=3363988 RepID=UPI0037B99BA5
MAGDQTAGTGRGGSAGERSGAHTGTTTVAWHSALSEADIESIHRQIDQARTRWSPGLDRGADASTFFTQLLDRSTLPSSVKDAAYRRVSRRGIFLDGLRLGRGAQSAGIVGMTSIGPVVAQVRAEYHEPRGPVLAPFEILSTPNALRLVNAQYPGLTARLLHHEDERLIVTSYISGSHAASNDGTRVDALARATILNNLPRALADLTTLRVPAEVRRHGRVDSVVSVLDRAAHVRAVRYPSNDPRLAEFGMTTSLFSQLRDDARAFTRRRPGILHNDLHYGNVLVQFDSAGVRPTGIKLLDFQGLSEGDPIQDLALAAVKFGCTPSEMRSLSDAWKAEVGKSVSADVDRDLPIATAAYGASQASVVLPNADHAVRGTAVHHRASLDQVIARSTSILKPLIGAVLTYAGETADVGRWVQHRLERAIPPNAAFIAVTGMQPAVQTRQQRRQTPVQGPASMPPHVTEMKRDSEKSSVVRRSREV